MSTFGNVDQALDFAINNEQQAIEFYLDLSSKAKGAGMADLFKAFAAEEQKHKAKLLGIKQSGELQAAGAAVADLKVSDYLAEVEPSDDMDLQAALTLAMAREKAAFKLYSDLAAAEPTLRRTFEALAQEEAGHKLKLETIYDDEILTDN